MVLMETSAPPESTLDLQQIPRDLMWKFVSNRDPDAPRYWVKLSNEVIMTCSHAPVHAICLLYIGKIPTSSRERNKVIY